MPIRTIKTETQGGGRTRVVTRFEYYETPAEKRRKADAEKAKQAIRREAEVKKICGVDVSDEIFKEYEGKKYDVPGEGMGMRSLSAIELLANSQEVAQKDPELQTKCQAIVDQVRSEIMEKQKQQTGLSFKPKHSAFSEYIGDLKQLYSVVADEREDLRQQYNQEKVRWSDAERTGETEAAKARAKANRLEAEERYKKQLEDLQTRTSEIVEEIRGNLSKHVSEFYAPDGARIDRDTMTLLQSGLKLQRSEVNALFEKHRNNPTMIRMLGEYANVHELDSQETRALYNRAMSGGSYELESFNQVADMVSNAVSSNETSAKVWGKSSGHFERLSGGIAEDMANVVIKP